MRSEYSHISIFYVLYTGRVTIGFNQNSFTAIEGLLGDISACAEIGLPSGKQLGCDIEIVFDAINGERASKPIII